MTFETEKTLNAETTRVNDAARERELERRLATDLDAFLATVGDDALFFSDEEEAQESEARPSASAAKRVDKRRRFLGWATTVAASALLGVVGWSTFVGVVSQKRETNAKTAALGGVDGDETSLVAWSVEKWGETDRAALWRQVEEQWVNVEILKGWDATNGSADGEENVLALDAEADDAANEAERADDEENAGIDVIAWNDALSDEGISLTPWAYDPLLRVAVLLR